MKMENEWALQYIHKNLDGLNWINAVNSYLGWDNSRLDSSLNSYSP